MRGAVIVASVLAGVVVVAAVLVGFVAIGSPQGPKQANTAATKALSSTTTTAKPKATPSTKKKSSAKPKPTPTATKAVKATKAAKAVKSSASAPTSSLLTVPAGWKLAFDPGFGTKLDTGTWATCYDWATNPSVGCDNNPTAEKEWYIPSQVNVSGGTLNLVAKQESTPGLSSSGAAQTYTCRSGMVSSKPGFNFTYGLIQISAKLPYGPGLWPALWLAATSDQWPPELDIMEHWYSEPQAKVYDHTVGKQYVGGPVPTPANLSAGFHTYSLLWTKDR
ncbi:MAG: glycoside hydrolase family 16 protein, partial [Trebonia sp.]